MRAPPKLSVTKCHPPPSQGVDIRKIEIKLVDKMDDDEFVIRCPENESVQNLKRHRGLDWQIVDFVFGGEVMRDDATLADYGISSGAIIDISWPDRKRW
jgi:hypothetical protein